MPLREMANSGKAKNMLDKLSGNVIIAQTPFDDRGAVDLESIDTLTEFYLKHGADGFVVLGVSGEGPRLAPQEALEVVSRFIARAGGKPVISSGSAIRVRPNCGCSRPRRWTAVPPA